MWRSVVWYKFTDVSEEIIVSIFRVAEYSRQVTNKKQVASNALTFRHLPQ
jgi:hypothetical protein